jgi:hypothetical protein
MNPSKLLYVFANINNALSYIERHILDYNNSVDSDTNTLNLVVIFNIKMFIYSKLFVEDLEIDDIYNKVFDMFEKMNLAEDVYLTTSSDLYKVLNSFKKIKEIPDILEDNEDIKQNINIDIPNKVV